MSENPLANLISESFNYANEDDLPIFGRKMLSAARSIVNKPDPVAEEEESEVQKKFALFAELEKSRDLLTIPYHVFNSFGYKTREKIELDLSPINWNGVHVSKSQFLENLIDLMIEIPDKTVFSVVKAGQLYELHSDNLNPQGFMNLNRGLSKRVPPTVIMSFVRIGDKINIHEGEK